MQLSSLAPKSRAKNLIIEGHRMLLAHGTTERNADLIYSCGYFAPPTYFLKCYPDPKLAFFGTAGFGLRHHIQTQRYIDLYCKQDLLMHFFKKILVRTAREWLEKKGHDKSPGLIFVVEAEEKYIDYYRSSMSKIFIPTECFSIDQISTDFIDHIVTLEENIEYFQKKYGKKTKSLESIIVDSVFLRLFNTFYTRWSRFFPKEKLRIHHVKTLSSTRSDI